MPPLLQTLIFCLFLIGSDSVSLGTEYDVQRSPSSRSAPEDPVANPSDEEVKKEESEDISLPETNCKTVGGISRNKACIFPFKNPFNGATHHACTHDHGLPAWCATRVNNDGTMYSASYMGFCSSNCPVEEHATCFAIMSSTSKSTWGTNFKKKERRPCVFPFSLNGKNYTQCAPFPRGSMIYPPNKSTPRCATVVDSKGVAQDLGYCQADCPGAFPAQLAVKAANGPGRGSRCVFPFWAEKVWNVECRPGSDGRKYCGTELTSSGSIEDKQYGYCEGEDTNKCTTVGGAKWGQACKFPFRSPWSNKLHWSCTTEQLAESKGSKTVYPSAPWCATKTDPSDKMDKEDWGFCSKSCAQEKYNYCYADVGTSFSSAKKCQLPFIYGGLKHFQCMKHNGQLKCATKVDVSGVAKKEDLQKCAEPRECRDQNKINGKSVSVGYDTIASYTNDGSRCLQVDFEYSTGVEDSSESNWNVEASITAGFSYFGAEFEASLTAGGGGGSSSSSNEGITHSLSYLVAPYSRVTLKQLVAKAGTFKAHSFKIKLEEVSLKTNKMVNGAINGQDNENGTLVAGLFPCNKVSNGTEVSDDGDGDDGDGGGDDGEDDEDEEDCSNEEFGKEDKKGIPNTNCSTKSQEEADEEEKEEEEDEEEDEEKSKRTSTTSRTNSAENDDEDEDDDDDEDENGKRKTTTRRSTKKKG